MKVENLKTGQVLKNYKELCDVLDIKVASGKQKQLQLKELERFIIYHKEGNKIFIDEIRSKELKKVDNRSQGNNIKYADDIEYLILELLNRFEIKGNERVGFSKNFLFSQCGLVNDNYRTIKGNTLKFSQMIDMPVQTISECFDYTNNRMLKTLQSTLNRMSRQSLITWSNGYNMVLVDDKGEEYLEIASTENEKEIMKVERSIMLQMGYTNKRLIFMGGQWNYFKEEATKQLKENYPDLRYYYDNISFNYNNKDIAKALNEYEILDKQQVKQNINNKFSKSLDGTIDRRHKKYKKEIPFGNSIKTIENYRKSDEFPQEQKIIKDTLINKDSPKVVLNKAYDKTKVKYLQKTFFEKYNPSNTKQITFNDYDIAEDNIPF